MQNRLPTFEPKSRPPLRRGHSHPTKGRAGFVYLMEFIAGFYKIGLSGEPVKRQKGVKSGIPAPVTLIHAVPVEDMAWAESYVHGWLASKRVKGEWFKLDHEDVKWFRSLKELKEELT